MLVTTLSRIDRIKENMLMYSYPDPDYHTEEERMEILKRCELDLIEEELKLLHYNRMAARILEREKTRLP